MSISRFSTPTKTRSEVNLDEPPAKSNSNEDHDHPLLLELSSLRTSLRKFQHVSHSSSMQLQSKMMESLLCQDENVRLKRELEAAKSELDGLRKSTPDGQLPSASSQALSELTLAHRRLSSKLDHTHSSFEESQKLVLVKEAEAATWKKERDAMSVLLQEWRDRVIQTEKEREEETIRRVAAEEELRITTLALNECQAGMPSAPVTIEAAAESDNEVLLNIEPSKETPAGRKLCSSCSAIINGEQAGSASIALPPSPSNILLGVQGVRRLLADFSSSLGASQERIALLETLADELKASKNIAMQEADEARNRYAKAQGELESIKADDFGAGKVVERYMAFTQKTTQQLHTHMQTANDRLSLTLTNLRSQLFTTQTLLSREESRSKQLRAAIDELAEGYERETFGRRREVGLRMKALEREERREEQGRRWVDRVRRERTRLDVSPAPASNKLGTSPSRRTTRLNSFGGGANVGSASSTSLSSMLGAPLPNDYAHGEQLSLLWDLLESGLQLFKNSAEDLVDCIIPGMTDREFVESPIDGRNLRVDSSLGRILLAQEIVLGLTADLDRETKRNVELEKERLGLLSNKWDESSRGDDSNAFTKAESDSNVVDSNGFAKLGDGNLKAEYSDLPVLSVGSEDGNPKASDRPPAFQGDTPELAQQDLPLSPSPRPVSTEISALIGLLRSRTPAYRSPQKALHDCAVSLSNLRHTRKELPNEYQTALQILLDGIHDVIEDVRVEVEIAIADDDRAAKGHQTVLSLNGDESAIKAASGFLDPERTKSRESNFARRLGDVEHDLVELKMAILDVQSEQALGPQQTDLLDPMDGRRAADPFTNLNLKTVSVRTPATIQTTLTRPAVSPGLTERHALGNNMKRGFFPALRRTFSGTTPVIPLSRAASSNNVQEDGVGADAQAVDADDGDVE